MLMVDLPDDSKTEASIQGRSFLINGRPTLEGRRWKGIHLEGLLPNARLVQGVFDDRNPATRNRWAYPDTGVWDPDRNTTEFVEAMSSWKSHGLLAFTINLQGGSPTGYSQEQPWHNSGIESDGSLRADYLGRLKRILDEADRLGMVVLLGVFYFGQDQRIADEQAVVRALDAVVDWVLEGGWRNVVLEVNNECDIAYDHEILKPGRVAELIARARERHRHGRRLLVGTSFGGGSIPNDAVIAVSDFVLLHGNGVDDPQKIRDMVRRVRSSPKYTNKPILFNEDDHFDFDKPINNMVAAFSEGASWGYFDYRMEGEGLADGYQSVPVDWGISSKRKRAFFQLLRETTGAK